MDTSLIFAARFEEVRQFLSTDEGRDAVLDKGKDALKTAMRRINDPKRLAEGYSPRLSTLIGLEAIMVTSQRQKRRSTKGKSQGRKADSQKSQALSQLRDEGTTLKARKAGGAA